MADKETGLNITVGAEADVNSAKKAAQDLTKGVLSSLKDGYIEVPAEIKVPIKNASKDLEKAQKDVIDQWKKTFKEGFSSSEKDLDNLTEAYYRFKRLAGKEHKAGSKQYKEISKLMGEQIQTYNTQKRIKSTQQVKQNNKQIKPKRARDFGKHSREEIDANIKSEQERRYKGVKLTGPKGYRTNSGVNPGSTYTGAILDSEGSPYQNSWQRVQAKHKAEEDKKTALSTKKWINKDYEPTKGKKSRATTETEYNEDVAKKALNELVNIIKAIEKGIEGITPEQVQTQLGVIKDLFQKNGKDLEETSIAIKNALEKPYSDSEKKALGGTKGGEKGVGPGHEVAKETQKMIYDIWGKLVEGSDAATVYAKRFASEMVSVNNTLKNTTRKTTTKERKKVENKERKKVEKDTQYNKAKIEASKSDSVKQIQEIGASLKSSLDDTKIATTNNQKLTEKQTQLDLMENSAERISDTKQEDLGKQDLALSTEAVNTIKSNTDTSTDTNTKTDKSIENQSRISKVLESEIKNILQKILSAIEGFGRNIVPPDTGKQVKNAMDNSGLPDLYRYFKDGKWMTAGVVDKSTKKYDRSFVDETDWNKIKRQRLKNDVEREREEAIKQNVTRSNVVQLSQDLAGAYKSSKVLSAIKKAFGTVDIGPNANEIAQMNQAQMERLRAERIARFGLPRTDKEGAIGGKAQAQYTKSLYGWGKNFPNPFKDLKLTEGIGIDSKGITDALQTAIQKNMFTAQTGGIMRNLVGSMTLYAGMPSLEKSRAEADAVNQVMANIRQVALEILQKIQTKETDLRGLESRGEAKFDASGNLMESSSAEAKKLFADMEEYKDALRGVLADAGMVEEVVKQTGGDVSKIMKQLGFASPELRKCNTIIQNINAGLDKNGKALKFQTRTAEVLNYTFQLMARSIGQMIKRWMLMLNPLNLIKRAFQDFASYDVKWQRTFNVIKYNLRRIIKPAMQWIAQQIVNMIGLVNALMKGIGKVFNKNWDLFDQSAANTEKMAEDFERINNVTASFDELHDISGETNSSDAAMDLMGDIYTPQWDGLNEILESIGETIGNIIKMVSGWTFWDWLKLAGLALAGFLALKWLLSIFGKGKNPLQSVADGFQYLEKAVGWAVLILALTQFTKALTDFVECMKTADWGDIAKSLLMLGGAFAELFLTAGGLMYLSNVLSLSAPSLIGVAAIVGSLALFTKALTDFIDCMKTADWGDIAKSLLMLAGAFAALVLAGGGLMFIASALGILAPQMLGVAVVVAAFAPVIWALSAFAEAIKGLTSEDMVNGLLLLAGAFMAITVAIGALLIVLSVAIASGVGALAILALAGILAVTALVILALAQLVKSLKDAGDDIKLILEGVSEVIEAFGTVLINVLSVIGEFIINLVSTIGEFIINLLSVVGEFIINFITTLGETISNIITSILEGLGTIITAFLEGIATIIQTIGDTIMGIINTLAEGISLVVSSVAEAITTIIQTVGETIVTIINTIVEGFETCGKTICEIVETIANAIKTVLEPIMEFVDSLIGKIVDLASTIVTQIGETIRSVIETVGNIVLGIINGITNAIPNLLNAILDFCREIGPAIENSCDAIMRTITKLINFVVSGIEYLVNTLLIDSINGAISAVTFGAFSQVFSHISIPRFVPQYEQGTNFVPNDQLAYLHKGETVIPAKYNQGAAYKSQDNAKLEQSINKLNEEVARIGQSISNGIPVKGQFVQRGSDLVASVERSSDKLSNSILSNKIYAR